MCGTRNIALVAENQLLVLGHDGENGMRRLFRRFGLQRRKLSNCRGVQPKDCVKTVPKPISLTALGLLLSEKQIPQVVVIIKNRPYRMEPLEVIPIPWALTNPL